MFLTVGDGQRGLKVIVRNNRQEVWRLVKLTLEVHGLLRLYLFLEMIYVHCFQSFIIRHCVLIPSCYPKIILMIIFEL